MIVHTFSHSIYKIVFKLFVELVRFMFTIPDVTCFLSEKLWNYAKIRWKNFLVARDNEVGSMKTPQHKNFAKHTSAESC